MSKLLNAWFNEATGEFFTPKLRMVYPKFLKAEINKAYPNNAPKFTGLGLIPKEANIDVLREAVTKFTVGLYGEKWKDKDPAVKMPIKKTAGNDRLADYAEAFPYFVSVGAMEEFPPAVFGPKLEKVSSQADIYGGRWAIYAVDVWGPKPEKKDVNRFVSLGIKRVQLLDHDERIGGGGLTTPDGFTAADIGGSSESGKPASTDDIF